jgi:hypothetical protein
MKLKLKLLKFITVLAFKLSLLFNVFEELPVKVNKDTQIERLNRDLTIYQHPAPTNIKDEARITIDLPSSGITLNPKTSKQLSDGPKKTFWARFRKPKTGLKKGKGKLYNRYIQSKKTKQTKKRMGRISDVSDFQNQGSDKEETKQVNQTKSGTKRKWNWNFFGFPPKKK